MKFHKTNRQLQLFKIHVVRMSAVGVWNNEQLRWHYHIEGVSKTRMQQLVTHGNARRTFIFYHRNRLLEYTAKGVVIRKFRREIRRKRKYAI